MPSTPANANHSFRQSEDAFTTIEGTPAVPAQVEVRFMPLYRASDFSPPRALPPRATCVLFVTLAARALEGRKMSGVILKTYTRHDADAHFALMSGVVQKK
jgi:hypothetical protein